MTEEVQRIEKAKIGVLLGEPILANFDMQMSSNERFYLYSNLQYFYNGNQIEFRNLDRINKEGLLERVEDDFQHSYPDLHKELKLQESLRWVGVDYQFGKGFEGTIIRLALFDQIPIEQANEILVEKSIEAVRLTKEKNKRELLRKRREEKEEERRDKEEEQLRRDFRKDLKEIIREHFEHMPKKQRDALSDALSDYSIVIEEGYDEGGTRLYRLFPSEKTNKKTIYYLPPKFIYIGTLSEKPLIYIGIRHHPWLDKKLGSELIKKLGMEEDNILLWGRTILTLKLSKIPKFYNSWCPTHYPAIADFGEFLIAHQTTDFKKALEEFKKDKYWGDNKNLIYFPNKEIKGVTIKKTNQQPS